MIKTNLLPYRAARKKENIRRQLSVFVLFFIFVASALCFFHFHLASTIKDLESFLAAKEKELQMYEAKAKEVDKIKGQLDVLEKKLKVMENLEKNRMDAVNLLDSLVALTVKGRMWINDVSSKGNGVKIDGIAIDNKTVAIFMSRIEKSNFLTKPELVDVVLVEEAGLKLKKFTLKCRVG